MSDEKCKTCGGSGEVKRAYTSRESHDRPTSMYIPCPSCGVQRGADSGKGDGIVRWYYLEVKRLEEKQ
jgi:hypothetical protein